MKIEEKQRIMEKLRRGEIDILVSTPLIEVGVDIPNGVPTTGPNSEMIIFLGSITSSSFLIRIFALSIFSI